MQKKAEIIAVGSELLTPDNIDTNSLYLTQGLNEAGCEVHLKSVVGDNREDIETLLSAALQRSDVIIFTGGLGPTEDDLTRIAVAEALSRPLSMDSRILQAIKHKFAARGFKMARINERQAQVIAGAEALDNSLGTAPGMWIEDNGRQVILLPGPPRELKSTFEREVLPRLRKLCGGKRLLCRSFHITGMTESETDSKLAPIYTAYPGIRTTILAGTRYIALRMYRWIEAGETPYDLDELAARIKATLGGAIFTASGERMEEIVGRQLRESRSTLAVAESCTAGMLGMHITQVPGSSDYFLGGVLCYSNEVKKNVCGVSDEVLERHGAVSAQVAEALARGVRHLLHSTIGLSITGIAGPGGRSPEKPVGLVYVGICDEERSLTKHRIMPGDRESIRERSTYLALSSLRSFLMH